jgi:hypothetical protein
MDRLCVPKTKAYKYSSARFIIVKLLNDFDLDDGVKFIAGKQESWERDYYLECNGIDEGKYLIFVEFDWHETVRNDLNKFNVTNYGPGQTIFANVQNEFSKRDVLRGAFTSKLSETSVDLNITDFSLKGAPLITRYAQLNQPEGYMYIILKN